MAIDMRVKGCPNEHCEMHSKKKKQKATMNYCPVCGSKLVFVCAKCFQEIENKGPSHRICGRCEAEKAEKLGKLSETVDKVKDKAGVAAVAIVAVAAASVKKVVNAEVAKTAGDVAHGVIDKLGDVIKK